MTERSRLMTSRRPGSLVGFALVVAVVVAGCGGGGGSDEAEGGATSTSAPTTEASSPPTSEDRDAIERQAVSNAYLAAEAAARAASAPPTPNPDHPEVIATHTGPMLEQTQELLLGLRANGWAIRYPSDSVYREEVDSVEFDGDDVAVLEVCAVDDGERFVVETGEVVASGVDTVAMTAAMRRVDGVWKLAERREEHRWEGEAGCAVD
jgi:hypothetical protein